MSTPPQQPENSNHNPNPNPNSTSSARISPTIAATPLPGLAVPEITIDPASPPNPPSASSPNASGSSTETEMPDRSYDKHRESSKSSSSKSSSKLSSKSSSKSSSASSSKSGSKSPDDWAEVMEPDERRRIQNRLAQRKFREKAKDQKETRERDADNQMRAAGSYSNPEPDQMSRDYDLSGLPWGGISMRHVVEKGRAREQSRAGSQVMSYYDYDYGTGRGGGSGSGRGSMSG